MRDIGSYTKITRAPVSQYDTMRNYRNWWHGNMWRTNVQPGRVAQSVGHLTRKSGILGSIPGLAKLLSFLLPLFKEGQLSVTGESMYTKY